MQFRPVGGFGTREIVPVQHGNQWGPTGISLGAVLPPGVHTANSATLASFPRLSASISANPEGRYSLDIAVIPKDAPSGFIQIALLVPDSLAGDQQACEKLPFAVAHYIAQQCGLEVVGGEMIKITDDTQRRALDKALAEINTLSALSHHVGGDAACLNALLRHPQAAAVIEVFGQRSFNEPIAHVKDYTYVAGQKRPYTVKVPDIHLPSVGFASDSNNKLDKLLSAANVLADVGLCEFALALLRTRDLEGHAIDVVMRSGWPAEVALSFIVDYFNYGMQASGHPHEPLPALMALMKKMQTDEHPKLLAPGTLPLLCCGTPEVVLAAVEMLRARFMSAMVNGDAAVVEQAIHLLHDATEFNAQYKKNVPEVAAAFHECLEIVKEHNALSTLEEAEFTAQLKAAGLKLAVNSVVLQPDVQFNAQLHGNLLLSHAQNIIANAPHPGFAMSFVFPLADFLLQHLSKLPADIATKLAGLCYTIAEFAGHSAGLPGLGRRVQPFVAFSLLVGFKAKIAAAGNTPEAINAQRWVWEKRQHLFGTLPPDEVEAFLADIDHGDEPADSGAALAFLREPIEPAVEHLAAVQSSSLSARVDARKASRETWAALGQIAIPQLAGTGEMQVVSDTQWNMLELVFADAAAILSALPAGDEAEQAQFLIVQSSVIDEIIHLTVTNSKQQTPFTDKIRAWATQALEQLGTIRVGDFPASRTQPLRAAVMMQVKQMRDAGEFPGVKQLAALVELLQLCTSSSGVPADLNFCTAVMDAISLHIHYKSFEGAMGLVRLVAREKQQHGSVLPLDMRPVNSLLQAMLIRGVNDIILQSAEPALKLDDFITVIDACLPDTDLAFTMLEAVFGGGAKDEVQAIYCQCLLHISRYCLESGETEEAVAAYLRALSALPAIPDPYRAAATAAVAGFVQTLDQNDPVQADLVTAFANRP